MRVPRFDICTYQGHRSLLLSFPCFPVCARRRSTRTLEAPPSEVRRRYKVSAKTVVMKPLVTGTKRDKT